MTAIPLPPSANKKKAPYSLDVEIPPGEYYRVEIVIARRRNLASVAARREDRTNRAEARTRSGAVAAGDVDNRIKPVMNALARCGLKQKRVVKITCRFGDETTAKVIPVRFR